MDGSSATITAVAAGDAVITITASDGSASASQGFTVTVAAAPANNPPVAVGTIPGSSLEIGGMSTIDAAGYFRDADGDELTYTGSSSNPGVATVAMEGSEATITAVTAGDAVITITASDGEASVSQGFRVDVNAGPKAATVVISRLLDANRQQIGDPTGISGTIYAVLDVQSNDETWNEIGLTLNGETVTPLCQGRTGGSSADAIAGPGLAAAGQVEIECQLNTNAVMGECVGMQLDPKYANGEYDLGAFLMTTTDERRDAVANQPIALDNHGFVKIAHMPGDRMEVGAHTAGLTFYGGPNAEGNVNMFHACPVAYDGTVVGKMRLSTRLTDTDQQAVDGTSLSFRESRFGSDSPSKEAPFTWSAGTQWWSPNNGVENMPGETETWIVNDGQILDPNGLDVTAMFRAAGETAKFGPLHFDFKAPAITGTSQVVIATSDNPTHRSWGPVTDTYYIDGAGGGTRRFQITEMSDMGVGHVYGVTSAIAVGDYSAGRNADKNPDTAFTPIEGLENVMFINQLDEEDNSVDGIADGGGVDTYVAELQSLADRLGNGTWLGGGRVRTASHFGVDRTAPEISRQRPSEALVLSSNTLHFEVEEPRLATGETASGLADTVRAWAGSSSRTSGRVYWSGGATAVNGSVTLDITPEAGSVFAREQSHTVYVDIADGAGNYTGTSFTFTRDQTDPVLSLSAVPSNFGLTTAKSVSVTVAGTLNDATEIRRAFLSIHAGATCAEGDDPLKGSQVSGPVRRLDNGTNSIEFSEVFTVKQGDDLADTSYCFYLKAEDDARDSDDRAAANAYSDMVSSFTVIWPGTKPTDPPPGPTFEFNTRTDDTDPATAAAADSLSVGEGATTGNVYHVTLKDAPASATYPLTLMVDPPATVTVAPVGGTDMMFASVSDTVSLVVTTAHDLNNVSELRSLTHSATGFDDTPFAVRVMDDDYAITVNRSSVREDDDAVKVAVTLSGAPTASPVSVGFNVGGAAGSGDFAAISDLSMTIAAGMTSVTDTVEVDATDDGAQDEQNEYIAVGVSGSDPAAVYYAPAQIMIIDDDPDIQLSLSQTEAAESAGAVTLTITATAKSEVSGIITAAIAIAGADGATADDFTATTPVQLRIDAGETVGTATTTVTISEDALNDDGETIEFTAPNVTVGGKDYTFGSVKLAIVDNDDS